MTELVHTWADADPYVTLCGVVIEPGVVSTANRLGVTCAVCWRLVNTANWKPWGRDDDR